MRYEIGELPLQTLLPAVARAEDHLARLDEIVRRSQVGEGFVERGHFFDAAASMWISGELVHVEDLVLHDAHMDIRAPTHELTVAHAILRSRRRIGGADAGWAISEAGVAALTGRVPAASAPTGDRFASAIGEQDDELDVDDDDFASEFAQIDALLDRSRRVLEGYANGGPVEVAERAGLTVGELVIRDQDWDEVDRLSEWRLVLNDTQSLPPVLAAALLFEAWEALEPMQRQHWLGGQLASAYLRSRGKTTSHVPAFHVGLRAIPREKRRAPARTTRMLAVLDAMSAVADTGMKEIARLSQAREQMERRLRGRRSSSSLPAVIELLLSRPIVSAAMIAKAAKVTPRGALNLITELGVREMTGRGRYRAWGVL